MKVNFKILLSILVVMSLSCTKDKEVNVIQKKCLELKYKNLEDFVISNGTHAMDKNLKNELDEFFSSIENKKSIQVDEIKSLSLNTEEKEIFYAMFDKIDSESKMDLFKITLVDVYTQKILKHYHLFDRLEPVVVKYKNDSVKVFLQAASSTLLPCIYWNDGDSCRRVANRTSFPVELSLKEMKFSDISPVIELDSNSLGKYIFKSWGKDKILPIDKSNLINAY